MQGRHLRPGEYFGHASWCKLREVDVTPKAGMVECGLAPLTADMSDMNPFQMAIFCVWLGMGRKGEYRSEGFRMQK
jgi:hypothetical protein